MTVPLRPDILNDNSLTFAEKIISIRAEGGEKVHHPGEITVLPADMAMAQDSTGPLAIKVFGEMGKGANARGLSRGHINVKMKEYGIDKDDWRKEK